MIYKLICQTSAQMVVLNSFLQMFKVLGMYNFGLFPNTIHHFLPVPITIWTFTYARVISIQGWPKTIGHQIVSRTLWLRIYDIFFTKFFSVLSLWNTLHRRFMVSMLYVGFVKLSHEQITNDQITQTGVYWLFGFVIWKGKMPRCLFSFQITNKNNL